MKQFDLFECQKELDIQAKREQMFQKWRLLPPERLILAGTPDRRRLGEELADGYCMVWEQALHRCQGLPPNQEIWLNHIEKPEYWVIGMMIHVESILKSAHFATPTSHVGRAMRF